MGKFSNRVRPPEGLRVWQNKRTADMQQIVCSCLGDINISDVRLGGVSEQRRRVQALVLHISSVIFHSRFVSVCPSCLSIGNVLIRWGHIVVADVAVGRKPAPYELLQRVPFTFHRCCRPGRRAGGSVRKLFSEHLTSHPAALSTLNRNVLWTSLCVETYL